MMVSRTEDFVRQHEERLKRKDNAKIDNRPSGICASNEKPTEGDALVGGIPREKESVCRARIVFAVYAVRPADWDGYSIKQIQDALVESRLLGSDAWDRLEGSVRSEKVHSKEEEKTIIEIEFQ